MRKLFDVTVFDKMTDSENDLSDARSEEHEGLREVYVLVKKPNTTSKAWFKGQ